MRLFSFEWIGTREERYYTDMNERAKDAVRTMGHEVVGSYGGTDGHVSDNGIETRLKDENIARMVGIQIATAVGRQVAVLEYTGNGLRHGLRHEENVFPTWAYMRADERDTLMMHKHYTPEERPELYERWGPHEEDCAGSLCPGCGCCLHCRDSCACAVTSACANVYCGCLNTKLDQRELEQRMKEALDGR